MSYHDLSECTLSADERRAEADKILEMIEGLEDRMTQSEQTFIGNICSTNPVSVKQLFWLRDIKDKYL